MATRRRGWCGRGGRLGRRARAGPAAIGAIVGSSIPLALGLSEPWQLVLLGVGALALLAGRLGVVWTLLGVGAAGAALALAGAPVP